jgi:hypothetical protein
MIKKLNKYSIKPAGKDTSGKSFLSRLRTRIIEMAIMFMFDAYEIVCWINFVDRFNFFDFCYDVNDEEQVM